MVLAVAMASAEAVMALGTRAYAGLAAADVWTLVVGSVPLENASGISNRLLTTAGLAVMNMPAWIVFGVCGLILVYACRGRHPRRRHFRPVN